MGLKWETPVQYVKGVGPKLAARLARLGLTTVGALLMHLPFRYIDRRQVDRTGRVAVGAERSVIGQVVHSGAVQVGRRRVYQVAVDDGSGPIVAMWFHFRPQFLERQFPLGASVLLTGEVSWFGRQRQFVHPESEILRDDQAPNQAARIIPVYASTEGLSQRLLRKIVCAAWEALPAELEDILPPALRATHRLLPRRAALEALHFPDAQADIAALNARRSPALRTLIFEEFFLLELGLAWRRATHHEDRGPQIPWDAATHGRLVAQLPFALTAAQQRVVHEIAQDLAHARPMHRLVQGDVGSGKTVVAAAAALQVIQQGWQVAIMAPTEILAEQHARTLLPWWRQLGMPAALLTGATRTTERRDLLQRLGAGELPLLIGTHALLETDVVFARLGLIVIDEQHRFGVAQRLALKTKGTHPHLLVLTATPIPRTLALTYYGDLDVSLVDQLPEGRKPIITKRYTEAQRPKLYEGLRKELARGRQAYVIYPLVAESETSDLRDATAMAQVLQAEFHPDYRVALLHGRMKGEEKERVMRAFHAGEVQILATTSVVEVGVDVPNATVMIVEHAERFGLSQLHQLRGRVGRGAQQSYCIVMTDGAVSAEAQARLEILCATTDGFRIAEEDLRLRGPGEFLGTRQSGLPELQVAQLVADTESLHEAREAAFALLARDPGLAQHPALRQAMLVRWGERLALRAAG